MSSEDETRKLAKPEPESDTAKFRRLAKTSVGLDKVILTVIGTFLAGGGTGVAVGSERIERLEHQIGELTTEIREQRATLAAVVASADGQGRENERLRIEVDRLEERVLRIERSPWPFVSRGREEER